MRKVKVERCAEFGFIEVILFNGLVVKRIGKIDTKDSG